MNETEIIELVYYALGDGFLIPEGREGWFYKCHECGQIKSGDDGEHGKDCSIGKAVSAVDEYMED